MTALLVDGNGLAYRAYFAFIRNPLRNSRGEETSVCYAFLSTLRRWLDKYAPERVIVVFDPPGRTHRHAVFPDYKANRPPRPESLAAQMPRLHELLQALRIPVVELPGWEADDVLATLVRHVERQGTRVVLASADKDLRQLISDSVRVLRPGIATGTDEEWGPAELERSMGLRPEQVVDWLALAGDASDNIPGVAGIGEKTALDLLRTHGSLAALLAHPEQVEKPALRQKIEAGRDAALLSWQLVVLREDAPVPEVAPWAGPDWNALRPLLQQLEFHQLLRQFAPADTAPRTALRVETTSDSATWVRWVEAARAVSCAGIAFVRTDGGRIGRLAAVAVAVAADAACAAEVAPPPPGPRLGELDFFLPAPAGLGAPDALAAFAALGSDPAVTKTAYDVKEIAFGLARDGAPLRGPFFDVLLAAYVLDPSRRPSSIDALSHDLLGDDRVPGAPGATGTAGAAAARAWALGPVLQERLVEQGLDRLFHEVEMPLLEVLLAMELEGVRVDPARLGVLAAELQQSADALAESIYAACGTRFNLQSPQQLGTVLFETLRLPHGRRTRSGWSTDVDVLEGLAAEHEVARWLLAHRQLTKLRSTYADTLPRLVDPVTGRIHTRFNQAVAATGRLSSSEPNLQNIPIRTELGRQIRAAFVPRDSQGCILSADYSQIELRLLAHLSGDPALVAAFQSGDDVHALTAARVFGTRVEAVTAEQRAAAKTVNFGVIYGMGPRGLADQLGIPLDAARKFIDDYFTTYPGVRRCTRDLVEQARTQGFTATLLGRRMRLPEITSSQPAQRAAAERLAVNAPIQGSAADLIKVAMIRVQARLGREALRSRLVLQVHDELVFDVAAGETAAVAALAREEMAQALPLAVPVLVDVAWGPSWAEAHR